MTRFGVGFGWISCLRTRYLRRVGDAGALEAGSVLIGAGFGCESVGTECRISYDALIKCSISKYHSSPLASAHIEAW